MANGPEPRLERAVLAYDNGHKAKEALFAAAYMGEKWGTELVVVTVEEPGHVDSDSLDHARAYLAMHEVQATFESVSGAPAAAIVQAAANHDAGLIVLGGHSAGRLRRPTLGATASELLQTFPHAILICP